jgi:glutamate-ammonia-ligase adenylyltransferase
MPAISGPQRDGAIDRALRFSPFLAQAIEALPAIVERFRAGGAMPAVGLALEAEGESVEVRLRRRRRGLALAVALGDLAGELTLEEVTSTLSDFADQAIDEALLAAMDERVSGASSEGFAVVALGKLGSRELNYSSDVDLLLLFDPDRMARREKDDAGEAAVRVARRMIELLQKRTGEGYVARVDLRLRPSPEVTPIVLPVNAAISHYESSALPWERAAFIRGRAAAGDRVLGQQFLDAIEPFVWRRSLDFGVIEEIRDISSRIRDHYAQGARLGRGYDLKRGRGGIREVEFFTQIQQMIHGGRDPSLRVPATMDALAALDRADWLDTSDAAGLADAYRLLRTIEHRAQMVDDAQTHLLPVARPALDELAQMHGLADGDALIAQLRPHVARVDSLFGSLGPDAGAKLSNDPDILVDELRELGFADPSTALRRIAEWRSGRPRSLRSPAALHAFEAMLPALLKEIATGADPDHALNRLSDIVDKLSSGVNLYRLIESRPALARLLARILAHAPALSEQLARRPQLVDGLIDSSSFDPPGSPEAICRALTAAMQRQPYDLALDRARRIVNERRFALGVQLIDHIDDPLAIGAGYARVAEGTLMALAAAAVAEFESAHGRIEGGELLILGLGRLGGGMLTHASDLDIIYLHTAPPDSVSDGPKPLGPSNYFNRLASRVTAAMSVPTAAGPLYDVDTRLRPEGERGMLVVSLDAFADYQRREAWTWEHMALTRARPLFGSDAARARAASLIHSILVMPRDPPNVVEDAVKMRAEIARHKPPSGELDVKLGPGGLVDLEFAVHVLQLTRSAGLDPSLEVAVQELVADGLIDAKVAGAQQLLTRMLIAFRLVLPGGGEPPPGTAALVARTCGFQSWDALLAEHREARQSISELWNRIRGNEP